MKGNKKFYIFLAVWFFINLIQAIYTNIQEDEAYYFLYSRHLAWGYFDHPPFVALLIHLSSLIFHNILKVRFFSVVLQPIVLWLIWQQLNLKNKPTNQQINFFFLSAFSVVMFTVYGFLSTPDAPLLFFTALFLYAYQQFLYKINVWNVVLLILSSTGLLYSKYQGFLVIALTLFSNPALFKKPVMYAIASATLLLFLPHIIWQFNNGFPSVKFHVVERAVTFKWAYFWEYIPNQLLSFNPIIFITAIFMIIKYHKSDLYHRALYYNIVGFVVLFWLTTFRGHAEPHWTIAAAVPMLIVVNEYLTDSTSFLNLSRKLIVASVILILGLRTALILNILPKQMGFSGNALKYEAIAKMAKNKPVVFIDNHIEPALYYYFTGKPAVSIATIDNRNSQFDIWNEQKNWIGKPVLIVGNLPDTIAASPIPYSQEKEWSTNAFFSTQFLQIHYTLPDKTLHSGDTIHVPIIVKNTLPKPYYLHTNDFKTDVGIVLMHKGQNKIIKSLHYPEYRHIAANHYIVDTLKIALPSLNKGAYKMAIWAGNNLGQTLNSNISTVEIVDEENTH
ncbi:ArnT family glycosyltransferase [Hydrotalea sandarakina]|jgi:hypothetical protein|uniref:Dolichyl-phosphate-mannose-protein mannosyltransferase n=1 Tax=Hydrotalea sandarakina TaxID=1004304 RepID=A0A2W7RXQ6_9BACT|nr:glycosyltransferase family 39 protein [Hydrotalea sandarakina]PZX59987.1 dolichyl-phosphate-mannose-protein mannosyltransferase [Hydrotalea sandarakina]